MKRFKNILVVFDSNTDNRALLFHAIDLAQRNQASMKVVDVIEETPSILPKPSLQKSADEVQPPTINIIEELISIPPVSPSSESLNEEWKTKDNTTEKLVIDIQEYIIQEEKRNLQQFVTAIKQAGIPVSSKTILGIPFIEIIKEVLRNQHDLVMITAEGSGGLKDIRFGNTTVHLMRKCPCPVWVIKPSQNRQFERILAAVDLDQEDNVRTALNTKIIELATSLARLGQSELLIIHAWRMVGESIIRRRGEFPAEQVEGLFRETKEAHRQSLIKLLQQHPLEDLKYNVYLLKGEAGELIIELAQTKAIELIIMGTISRAGIAGLLIGNTAEKVLRKVDSSILVIKPEGFITPVTLDTV